MLFLVLLLGLGHSKLTVSPSKPVPVSAGSAVQFKANVPVAWSLAPGSPGTIDTNGTYHAPASVRMNNALGGCQMLPNDHIFNTRIDSLPVHSRSAEWMAGMAPGRLAYYESWGINIADSSTPRHPMHFSYSPEYDGEFEIPAWPNLKRENGYFSGVHSDVDRHVITVDRESCQVFELYNNYAAGENTQCPTCTAQSGAKYASMSYALPAEAAADAAGLQLAPLSIHLNEMRSGSIRHAARFTLGNKFISPSSVWPARAHAGAWGKVPYGTRFRLRSDFDISSYSHYAQVLLTELKEYGMFLADGGSNFEIQTATDVTLDPDIEAAFLEVHKRGPQTKDLEIVDESELMVSADSGRVNPHSAHRQSNTPVIVIATEMKDQENRVEVTVPLQGVSVGVHSPSLWIQSGVNTQLAAWVNGSSDKSVQWSMNPSLGTLSSAGEFAAPAVDHPTIVMATAMSVADPQAKTTVAITVMPAGAIRIATGNATRAPGTPNQHAPDYGPDSEGHMWWRAQAGEMSWGVMNDDWSGQPWPHTKDISLYYTSRYSFGDMLYKFLVPNGNYKITLHMAQPQCKDHFPREWRAPIHLEAQGQIILRDFDIGKSIDYSCLTPAVQSIPATVKDNSLYFALRRITLPNSAPSPLISAFSIAPDHSPAHLSIDPSTISDLQTGDQIHLYSVGWYMSNEATWSVKGPGSVGTDGAYSAPLIPMKGDQSVTIEAKSKGDASKTSQIKFMLRPGAMVVEPSALTTSRTLSQPFKVRFGHAAYTNIDWTLAPSVGTITEAGVYTAPASLDHDTEVMLTGRSRDLPDHSVNVRIMVKVAPDPIRIHCGEGPAFKDAQGNLWEADRGYSKDTVRYRTNVPIKGASADMQYLYNSATYRYENEPFSYHFDVPNGRYSVTLKFADYAHDEPGHYSFDVALNGKKVLHRFDPDQEKGTKQAIDKTFQTTVTGKAIQLDFLASMGAAFINGIEIIYLGPN